MAEWWCQCMQITVCEYIDTFGGSMGSHIYILVLPWIVMQYSFLYSIYFIHQLKEELTCDIDSYGTHEADLYSWTGDDIWTQLIIRMTNYTSERKNGYKILYIYDWFNQWKSTASFLALIFFFLLIIYSTTLIRWGCF